MSAGEFAERVLTLALRFRFSVQSWGRSAVHNAAVGGVANSYHLSWRAVDLVLDAGEDAAAFDAAAERMGLKVLDEGDHRHVQPA